MNNESEITNEVELFNVISGIKEDIYESLDSDFNTCNQIALIEVALELADNVDDFIELFIDVIEGNCFECECDDIDSIVNLCLTGK